MSSKTIELRRRFDSRNWQIAARGSDAAPTLLVTWQVEPEPVDAGVPPLIQTVLTEALCGLGPCWFAGDLGSATPVATLSLRRGLSRRQAMIFRAERAAELLPAFEAGAHDWSMAAQWIVVSSGPFKVKDILPLIETLLGDWELPTERPEEVPLIVQAGVDGVAVRSIDQVVHRNKSVHRYRVRDLVLVLAQEQVADLVEAICPVLDEGIAVGFGGAGGSDQPPVPGAAGLTVSTPFRVCSSVNCPNAFIVFACQRTP